MAKVEEKKPVVEEISESVKGAKAVVLAQYSGINVADDTALRKELREAGVTYKVYKNTMMNFAFKGTELEPLCDYLKGPNAIAISKDDETAPARSIAKYAKKVEPLGLVASVVDGKFYDKAATEALSEVPSRDVLLGRLCGSMQSPISKLARVLKQIAEKDGETAAQA